MLISVGGFFRLFLVIMFIAILGFLLFFFGTKFNLGAHQIIKPVQIQFQIPKDKIKNIVLDNGMRVIIFPDHSKPKVFLQIIYDVGSAHEESYEKGLAHLIEHMIFKGTDKLSESDVAAIARKYGAMFNAATGYDMTKYYFEVSKANWKEFLPIMADCMQNAKFDPDHLASELKTVVQELNRLKDDFYKIMLQKAFEFVFPSNHPYHYPVIGFKNVLANLTAQQLHDFYRRNYCPEKATLFIVGDIDPIVALDLAKENFSSIEPGGSITENQLQNQQDHIGKNVIQNLEEITYSIHADVAREEICFFWEIPGAKFSNDAEWDLFTRIVFDGKNSLLHKRLIDKEGCAEKIFCASWQVKLGGVLGLFVIPKPGQSSRCEEILKDELDKIIEKGFLQEDITKEIPKLSREFIEMLQNFDELTELWSRHYLNTGEIEEFFSYIEKLNLVTNKDLSILMKKYFGLGFLKRIYLKPLKSNQRSIWEKNNHVVRQEEDEILNNHSRTSPVEPVKFANELPDAEILDLKYPLPTAEGEFNGLKTIFYKNTRYPLTHFVLKFREMDYLSYSPEFRGLDIMMQLLNEGSVGISKKENLDYFSSLGASVSFNGDGICCSVLSSNFSQVLERIFYMIKNPTFKKDAFERLRDAALGDLERAKTDPASLARDVFGRKIFAKTEFDFGLDDKIELLKSMSIRDIMAFHHQLNPYGCVAGISGDFDVEEISKWLEKITKNWNQNASFQARSIPEIKNQNFNEQEYIKLLRDQTLLSWYSPSNIGIDSPKYPYYNLISHMVFGGIGSRIFKLRESTGLFYVCSGHFAAEAIKSFSVQRMFTLVNDENVEKTKDGISEIFKNIAKNGFFDDELMSAKVITQNRFIDMIYSEKSLISIFVNLAIRDLPYNFYEDYWNTIKNASVGEVNQIFATISDPKTWFLVGVGPGNFTSPK